MNPPAQPIIIFSHLRQRPSKLFLPFPTGRGIITSSSIFARLAISDLDAALGAALTSVTSTISLSPSGRCVSLRSIVPPFAQQHLTPPGTRRSRKMWGGGACDDRGPTFCLRQPSAGAPGGKRLPGAEGPPEGNCAVYSECLAPRAGCYLQTYPSTDLSRALYRRPEESRAKTRLSVVMCTPTDTVVSQCPPGSERVRKERDATMHRRVATAQL